MKTAAPAARATPEVALIAAVAANGVIGADNALPWRLPDDLKRFRALTTGHAVIMGRKTWESLPRALPERQNIVVTRQPRLSPRPAPRSRTRSPRRSRSSALPAPAFCIGGGELYRAALPLATTLHLTEIDRDFDGDARFPPFERGDWRETSREHHPASEPGRLRLRVRHLRTRNGARLPTA